MSSFYYSAPDNDNTIMRTGFTDYNEPYWGSEGMAFQGFYTDDSSTRVGHRIGVMHIGGDLSALKGSNINSIVFQMSFTAAGMHTVTKHIIFRKSHKQGLIDKNTHPSYYLSGDGELSDDDILGTLTHNKFSDNNVDFYLNSSSNTDFFNKLKAYIEEGNDTLIIYNPDKSHIHNLTDGLPGAKFSYEYLGVSNFNIDINYSKSYTITLNANGGNFIDSGGNKTTAKTFTKYENQDISIPSYTPSKDRTETSFNINGDTRLSNPSKITQKASKYKNFSFSKWNTSSGGGGTSYDSGETYSGNQDVTLYAIYDSNYTYSNNKISGSSSCPWWTIEKPDDLNATYVVKFDGNGGTCEVSSLSADKITTWVLDGWYSGPNGSGTKYNSNSSFTSQTQLYANWKSTTTTNSIVLPDIGKVHRKGYDFINWNTSASGTGTAYNPGASYTPVTNTTLYAFYEAKGLVRIYVDGIWRESLVFVFDGTKWVQAMPHVFDGTTWKLGG